MRSLPALPHPGDRAGAPSVPVSSAARSRTRAASSSCSTRSISSWSRCVLWYAMLHLFYPAGYIGRAAGREVFSLPSRSEQLPLVFTPGLLWGRGLTQLQSLTKTDSGITVTHPLVLLKTPWPSQSFSFSLRTFSALPLSR